MGNPRDLKVIKVKVTAGAKAVISTTADALDMKEQGVASRIYEWFGRQSDDVRRAVLGLYGMSAKQVLRGILADLEAQEQAAADEWAARLEGETKDERAVQEQEGEKSGRARKRKRA